MQLALDWWSYHNSLRRRKIDFAAVIRRAAELGAVGVALEYFALPEAWRAQPIKLLSLQSELRLAYIVSFGIPLAAPFSTWAWYLRQWKTCLSLASAISSPLVCLPLRQTHPLPTGPRVTLPLGARQTARRARGALQKLCSQAADYRLRVAILDDPGLAPETLLEILDAADCPNLALTVSTQCEGKDDPYRRVSMLAPFAGYVRCGDALRSGMTTGAVPLGAGHIDFDVLSRLLSRLEYRGFCGVRIDAPWWKADREDEWVKQSFIHLSAVQARMPREVAE